MNVIKPEAPLAEVINLGQRRAERYKAALRRALMPYKNGLCRLSSENLRAEKEKVARALIDKNLPEDRMKYVLLLEVENG